MRMLSLPSKRNIPKLVRSSFSGVATRSEKRGKINMFFTQNDVEIVIIIINNLD